MARGVARAAALACAMTLSGCALPGPAASAAPGASVPTVLVVPGSSSPTAVAPTPTPTTAPSAASAATSSSAPRPSPSPASAAPTQATTLDPRSPQLQAILDEHLAEGWYPNAIVGVWSPRGEWVGTVGTSAGAPVTRDLHTRIGSVTKTFTTTVILQLAQEGRLSLDDPLGRYVEGMPNPDATLRHLATMTAGIPAYTDMQAVDDAVKADHARAWTADDVLAQLRTQAPLSPPGQAYYYSNSNTVLLGVVAQKVTGKPIGTLITERILQPLGLRQTSYPTTAALPPPFLRGITDEGEIGHTPLDATDWHPSILGAAGAMVSTLDDLHTWAVALATGKGILSEQAQAQRLASLEPTVWGNSSWSSYGLGLQRRQGWVGHLGEVAGYTTMVEYKPDTQTAVVVIVGSNIYAENVERPAEALFDVLSRALA